MSITGATVPKGAASEVVGAAAAVGGVEGRTVGTEGAAGVGGV